MIKIMRMIIMKKMIVMMKMMEKEFVILMSVDVQIILNNLGVILILLTCLLAGANKIKITVKIVLAFGVKLKMKLMIQRKKIPIMIIKMKTEKKKVKMRNKIKNNQTKNQVPVILMIPQKMIHQLQKKKKIVKQKKDRIFVI